MHSGVQQRYLHLLGSLRKQQRQRRRNVAKQAEAVLVRYAGFLVDFTAVLCRTTTWNDQILHSLENRWTTTQEQVGTILFAKFIQRERRFPPASFSWYFPHQNKTKLLSLLLTQTLNILNSEVSFFDGFRSENWASPAKLEITIENLERRRTALKSRRAEIRK